MPAFGSFLKVVVVAALILAISGLILVFFQMIFLPRAGEVSVVVLNSTGRCGGGESELVLLSFDGQYAVIRFIEPTSNPCYRHVVESVRILQTEPATIIVKLRTEKTSEVCIQCTGIVETRLRLGPLKAGCEIEVNGLRIKV